MKNKVMHHPPMVKDDFQITELPEPPFTGGGNILTIVHSLEDSFGSMMVFDYGARSILGCKAFRNAIKSPCSRARKRKNHLLKNL
ncbi:MAG: hypothetical protein CMI66_08165 [Pedosphaera sp.]|nr:hypothetical protein [Pedosphaera sp.]HCP39165.1 hypothetical protein [Verrucomicrobiales bacterium]